MKILQTMAASALLALMAGCAGDSAKWHINGNINSLSDSDVVLLEGNNQGYWYVIDTIHPDSDGNFDYGHEPQGYPDIYRVRVGEHSVYFPIDSIETVSIRATAPRISDSYTLSGTPQAENIARVDSILLDATRQGIPFTDQNLKRTLGRMILAEPDGLPAYYIISKSVGGKPLFNPADRMDNRLIGAVANAFDQNRPSDPRTNYLKRLFLDNREHSSTPVAVEAQLVGAFNIELYDYKGEKHSLSELADKGKTVLLSFTAYDTDWSPAFNVELNRVYEKYRDRGFEIYQVSVDTDEYAWKQTAKNLPWITVLNNVADSKVLRDYNVTSLPTTFVINREGEIVERILAVEDIDPSVARNL